MGEAGDLLLIFADALVRSWKQITKFKANSGAAPKAPSPPATAEPRSNGSNLEAHHDFSAPSAAPQAFNLEGLIRDERGIHMAPESDD